MRLNFRLRTLAETAEKLRKGEVAETASREMWKARVEAWAASGLSGLEYAAKAGVHRGHWRVGGRS